MKCFFAFKESNDVNHAYDQLLKVSVYSALKNTDLDLYCLFDGQPSETTQWLQKKGVTVIYRRTCFYDKIREITIEKIKNPDYLNIGAGAFLRVEIPAIMLELGFDDDYVLYTDCDVMFQQNVAKSLSHIKPRYFAVAPEFHINNYRRMNSGVMVMNVKNLLRKDVAFRKFIADHLGEFIPEYKEPVRAPLVAYWLNGRLRFYPTWDQSAYQRFFSQNWLGSPSWDKLPPRFNWKPYWGDGSKADIVHFHGPKPNQAGLFTSNTIPIHLQSLIPLATPGYFQSSRVWNAMWEALSDG